MFPVQTEAKMLLSTSTFFLSAGTILPGLFFREEHFLWPSCSGWHTCRSPSCYSFHPFPTSAPVVIIFQTGWFFNFSNSWYCSNSVVFWIFFVFFFIFFFVLFSSLLDYQIVSCIFHVPVLCSGWYKLHFRILCHGYKELWNKAFSEYLLTMKIKVRLFWGESTFQMTEHPGLHKKQHLILVEQSFHVILGT